MENLFNESNNNIPNLSKLVELKDISGLVDAVEYYSYDDIKRLEAIGALGNAVAYWSGFRFAPADKVAVKLLIKHQKEDPNQGVRLEALRVLNLLRGISLLGDEIEFRVDYSTLSFLYQKEEIDNFVQAQSQKNWPLALELIEKIWMLPAETCQPDDLWDDNLIRKYVGEGIVWPMDNQPTMIVVKWLNGYLKNLSDIDKENAIMLWIQRGTTIFNFYSKLFAEPPYKINNVNSRMEATKGLIYAGTTRQVLWDNADAVSIAGCLLYLFAWKIEEYISSVEFIDRANKLNPNHANASMCKILLDLITPEIEKRFK